jgi:hypothetical protein
VVFDLPQVVQLTITTARIAAAHVKMMLGTSEVSNFPIRNWKSVIGVARIGSSVRCCFSATIEKAAEIEDNPTGRIK